MPCSWLQWDGSQLMKSRAGVYCVVWGTQILMVMWCCSGRKKLSEVGLECAHCFHMTVHCPNPSWPRSALLQAFPWCFQLWDWHSKVQKPPPGKALNLLSATSVVKKRANNSRSGSHLCECHGKWLKCFVTFLVAKRFFAVRQEKGFVGCTAAAVWVMAQSAGDARWCSSGCAVSGQLSRASSFVWIQHSAESGLLSRFKSYSTSARKQDF